MKTKKFAIVVLLVIGFVSVSLSSINNTSSKFSTYQNWCLPDTSSDTTDSNGGGIIFPPIGH